MKTLDIPWPGLSDRNPCTQFWAEPLVRADIGLWGRALWGQPAPHSFSNHTQGAGTTGGAVC